MTWIVFFSIGLALIVRPIFWPLIAAGDYLGAAITLLGGCMVITAFVCSQKS